MADVQFRAVNATTDLFRLRQLHDECFPISYDQEFYNWLSRSPNCLCLLAVAAVSNKEKDEDHVTTNCCDGLEGVGVVVTSEEGTATSSAIPVRRDARRPTLDSSSTTTADGTIIIGFLVGKLKKVHHSLFQSETVGYVSTIGVDKQYRQQGLGRALLQLFQNLLSSDDPQLRREALDLLRDKTGRSIPVESYDGERGQQNRRPLPSSPSRWWHPILRRMTTGRQKKGVPDIANVYLHCLASDSGTVAFYRRMQYEVVDALPEYYEFHEQLHTAYLLRRCLKQRPATTATTTQRPSSLNLRMLHESLQEQDALDYDNENDGAVFFLSLSTSSSQSSSSPRSLARTVAVGVGGSLLVVATILLL